VRLDGSVRIDLGDAVVASHREVFHDADGFYLKEEP